VNKIIPNSTQSPVDTRSQKAQKADTAATESQHQQTVAAASPDTVKLSSQAVDLSQLEHRISQLPDTDVARVVDLNNRITSGEYQIDSERIASKMLDMEALFDS